MKLMKNKQFLNQKFSRKVLVPLTTVDFTSRISKSYVPFTCKRSVMITKEMCPIRAEISTHTNLLFVWLAVIGFRQNYFYILPNCGDFGTKISFFHYIINQKRNNFIKHCSPPCTKKPQISEMCIYIKSSLYEWGLGTRGGTMFYRQKIKGVSAYNTQNTL